MWVAHHSSSPSLLRTSLALAHSTADDESDEQNHCTRLHCSVPGVLEQLDRCRCHRSSPPLNAPLNAPPDTFTCTAGYGYGYGHSSRCFLAGFRCALSCEHRQWQSPSKSTHLAWWSRSSVWASLRCGSGETRTHENTASAVDSGHWFVGQRACAHLVVHAHLPLDSSARDVLAQPGVAVPFGRAGVHVIVPDWLVFWAGHETREHASSQRQGGGESPAHHVHFLMHAGSHLGAGF